MSIVSVGSDKERMIETSIDESSDMRGKISKYKNRQVKKKGLVYLVDILTLQHNPMARIPISPSATKDLTFSNVD